MPCRKFSGKACSFKQLDGLEFLWLDFVSTWCKQESELQELVYKVDLVMHFSRMNLEGVHWRIDVLQSFPLPQWFAYMVCGIADIQ